eukprot:SAG31_NODE_208_length_20313_cov_6.143119_2_plen_779_part_00
MSFVASGLLRESAANNDDSDAHQLRSITSTYHRVVDVMDLICEACAAAAPAVKRNAIRKVDIEFQEAEIDNIFDTTKCGQRSAAVAGLVSNVLTGPQTGDPNLAVGAPVAALDFSGMQKASQKQSVPPLAKVPVAANNPSVGTAQGSIPIDHLQNVFLGLVESQDRAITPAQAVRAVCQDVMLRNLFNLSSTNREVKDVRVETMRRSMSALASASGGAINYRDFVEFVNQQHSSLPSLKIGAYKSAHRIISINDDGCLAVTAIAGKPSGQSQLLKDSPIFSPVDPAAKSEPFKPQLKLGSTGKRTANLGARGAFDSSVMVDGNPMAQDIAALIGVADAMPPSVLNNEGFFRRRKHFRKRMKARMRAALLESRANVYSASPNVCRDKQLDLPGYWTRPKLTEAYPALLEHQFDLCCMLPNGKEEDFSCAAHDRMSELLEEIFSRYEDSVESSSNGQLPVADATELVLQARGFFDFLDGDEQLVDYLHIRRAVQTQATVKVTARLRNEVIAQLDGPCFPDTFPLSAAMDGDAEENNDGADEAVLQTLPENIAPKLLKHLPASMLSRRLRVRVIGIDQLAFKDGLQDPHLWAISPGSPANSYPRRMSIDNGAGSAGHGHGKKTKEKPTTMADVNMEVLYVSAGIYYGGELLHENTVRTKMRPRSTCPRWNEWLDFDCSLSRIPLGARLCVTVHKKRGAEQLEDKDGAALGWAGVFLYDDTNTLRTHLRRRLWCGLSWHLLHQLVHVALCGILTTVDLRSCSFLQAVRASEPDWDVRRKLTQ